MDEDCWNISDEESAREELDNFEQDLNHGIAEVDRSDYGDR